MPQKQLVQKITFIIELYGRKSDVRTSKLLLLTGSMRHSIVEVLIHLFSQVGPKKTNE